MKVSSNYWPTMLAGKGQYVLIVFLFLLISWQLQRSLPYGQLGDFGSFIASGRAAETGLNPYGVYPPLTFHVMLDGFSSWNPNLNPPVSLPLFQILGKLDPSHAFRLWWSFSFLLYIALAFILVNHYRPQNPWLPFFVMLAAAGFWDTLLLGQIYVPLAFAAALGWVLLEKGKYVLAGILIGLVVAVKPNFMVWPTLLLLAGHIAPAVVSIISAALFSILPALYYGTNVYKQWAEVISKHPTHLDFPSNASFAALAQRFGVPEFSLISGMVLLLAFAVWVWRFRPGLLHTSSLGLLGALLASPLGWVHYTLFLLPIFVWAQPSRSLVIAALLLMLPVSLIINTFMNAPSWQQCTFGSAYTWALILLLIHFWKSPATYLRLSDIGLKDTLTRV
jgi:hypothetical protein